jgi:Tfp pilus assembly protein PilF
MTRRTILARLQAKVFYQLGMSAFRREDSKIALKFMARACTDAEAPAMWHRNHAEILDRYGRPGAAEAAARIAVRRDPGLASAWDTLGTILVKRDALVEGRSCYEHAVQIEPTFVQALNNLAVTLEQLGQLGAAEVRYKQALRFAPANTEIQLNFATLLRKLRRYAEGLEIVRQVLARYPEMERANAVALEYTRDLAQGPPN